MARSNNLAKNSTVYALGEIIPRLFSFITFPILTTYLVPSDYGIVSYVGTVNTFLYIIGVLGLNTYYLVHYFRIDDVLEQKKLLGNISIFVFCFNLLLTVLFYLLGPLLFSAWGSNIDFYPYLAIGLAANFFDLLSVFPMALFRVQERPLPLTILNITKAASGVAATLILVVVFKYTAKGVLMANLIVSFIFGIIFLIITFKNAIWNINWPQIKIALKFSLPIVPGSLAYYLYSSFDRILIDKYLTLTDLGLYSTATTLALLLGIVYNGAYKAFEPHFFKTYGQPDFNLSFQKVRDTLLYIVLICGICIGIYAKEFFQIFASEKYITAYLYVPLIVIGPFASAISLMYSTIVTARGKTKINAVITIMGGAVSISLNIVFLRYFGIWASASILSFCTILVMLASIYFSNIRIDHTRVSIASILSIAAIFFAAYFVNLHNIWVSIGVKAVIVLSIIYIITSILRMRPLQIIKSLVN